MTIDRAKTEPVLQAICEEVEAEYEMGGLSCDGGLYSDYAKEVARRFAALVRAQVLLEMKSDSGHSAAADAGASTAPLPEGKAATARELAAMFRQFTKSSHRWHDGRSVHIVAAEVLEHFASTGADTGRHGSDVQAESGASLVKTADGEGAMR